jgi:hypothetical protein
MVGAWGVARCGVRQAHRSGELRNRCRRPGDLQSAGGVLPGSGKWLPPALAAQRGAGSPVAFWFDARVGGGTCGVEARRLGPVGVAVGRLIVHHERSGRSMGRRMVTRGHLASPRACSCSRIRRNPSVISGCVMIWKPSRW